MSTLAHIGGHLDHSSTTTTGTPVLLKVPEETSTRCSHKPRGRKLGVRTVSDGLESHRRAWLFRFTRPRGMNLRLCQLLSAPDSFVSHLLAGRRTFTNGITKRIEEVLGLVSGTIDAGSGVEDNKVPVAEKVPGKRKSVLDASLAQALVNVLNRALSEGEVSNAIAIKILVDLTSS
jgi:hypothetical protein